MNCSTIITIYIQGWYNKPINGHRNSGLGSIPDSYKKCPNHIQTAAQGMHVFVWVLLWAEMNGLSSTVTSNVKL
jgi:hypothetical protein